jgi:hypothetical protein
MAVTRGFRFSATADRATATSPIQVPPVLFGFFNKDLSGWGYPAQGAGRNSQRVAKKFPLSREEFRERGNNIAFLYLAKTVAQAPY